MITITLLKESKQVVDDLAWPYDFDLSRGSDDSSWITLKPSMPFQLLAGDGTGGIFIAYGKGAPENLPILHATSEGQAGKIARNLDEAVALHIQMPYWRDVLKFSGNGDLAQMRRAAPFLEQEYSKDMPELQGARRRILNRLSVTQLQDPMEYLHRCICETDCTLVADDGWVWESLFSAFTIDQNRNWQLSRTQ